jgi:hypothetical protein
MRNPSFKDRYFLSGPAILIVCVVIFLVIIFSICGWGNLRPAAWGLFLAILISILVMAAQITKNHGYRILAVTLFTVANVVWLDTGIRKATVAYSVFTATMILIHWIFGKCFLNWFRGRKGNKSQENVTH